MKKLMFMTLVVLLAATAQVVSQSSQTAPPPPSAEVPPLETARPPVLCVACDEPFSIANHGKILKDLAANPFEAELRRALYWQDSLHQFESRAHFDNCFFGGGVAYVDDLLAAVGDHAEKAQQAQKSNDHDAVRTEVLASFFSLGQALHAVQDFYAHSNYIELTEAKVERTAKWELIQPWTESGKRRISQLEREGLVSGYVAWGLPKKCPEGTQTHGELAKDSEATPSGSQRIPHLQNLSRFKAAVFLARETSLQLMEYSFARWPILKAANGEAVAIDLLVDRRGL